MKKKIFILVMEIIGVILIITGIILACSGKLKINVSNTMDKEILKLVKNDYIISNILYGTPKTVEDYFFIEDVQYKKIDYDDYKTLNYPYSIIDNTYTGVTHTYFNDDVNKYNKYMLIDDIVYVNINSKCDIGKFDKNISTYFDKNNNIIIKSNGRETKAEKINGKYKLDGSLYNCIEY